MAIFGWSSCHSLKNRKTLPHIDTFLAHELSQCWKSIQRWSNESFWKNLQKSSKFFWNIPLKFLNFSMWRFMCHFFCLANESPGCCRAPSSTAEVLAHLTEKEMKEKKEKEEKEEKMEEKKAAWLRCHNVSVQVNWFSCWIHSFHQAETAPKSVTPAPNELPGTAPLTPAKLENLETEWVGNCWSHAFKIQKQIEGMCM